MKKIFTLALGLIFAAAPCFAQEEEEEIIEDCQFVYADGTVVPNGSTVTVTKAEEDPFTGKAELKSGLYVKNTLDEASNLSVEINVQTLPNGTIQLCFPVNCMQYGRGVSETSKGALKPGTVNDLQTEWFPEKYGTAKVTYTLKMYTVLGTGGLVPTYQFDGVGPKVTVIYQYADPSGIADVKALTNGKAQYFDMQGREVANPTKGMYIVKTNGTSKKVNIR